jgi:hypothetical protein
MDTAFEHEEPLTHEEVLARFKKVLGRDMAPEEKHSFFLPPELPTESDSETPGHYDRRNVPK